MKGKKVDLLRVYSAQKLALEASLDELVLVRARVWGQHDTEEARTFFLKKNRDCFKMLERLICQYLAWVESYPVRKKDRIRLCKANAQVWTALTKIVELDMSVIPLQSKIYDVRRNLGEALGIIGVLLREFEENKRHTSIKNMAQ